MNKTFPGMLLGAFGNTGRGGGMEGGLGRAPLVGDRQVVKGETGAKTLDVDTFGKHTGRENEPEEQRQQ